MQAGAKSAEPTVAAQLTVGVFVQGPSVQGRERSYITGAALALAVERSAQLHARCGNDGFIEFGQTCKRLFLAQKGATNLGPRRQLAGVDLPISHAALRQQGLLELAVAPGHGFASGYIDAAQHAAIGCTDRQRAINAAEQLVPMRAVFLVFAVRQREARHRHLEHDVVIGKNIGQPAPDLAFFSVGQHARIERPALRDAPAHSVGAARPSHAQQGTGQHAAHGRCNRHQPARKLIHGLISFLNVCYSM